MSVSLQAIKKIKIAVFFPLVLTAVFGCKKSPDKPDGPTGAVTNKEINQWITDSLKRYYYWADALPTNVNLDQDPIAFFNVVKNSSDRFSYLFLPGGASSVSPTMRAKYGFDYLVITDPVSSRAVGLITLVMNTSPAQAAGLRRGQYFSSANGTVLTSLNAATLQSQMLNAASIKLGMATLESTGVKDGGTVTISAGTTFEQTALQKTFNINGKKIGYLFFTAFNAAERADYLAVFSSFKADGITDMILDMRYNAGGDVSAAATMAALIGSQAPDDIFIEYRGNTNGGTRKESFSVASSASGGPSFTQIQQRMLGLTRLYVITTPATASAAELMINNLKPYLTVVQVGETTRGKDEAAIVITDKRTTKRINWELSPIVYKLFNAQGLGGYSGGIAASYPLTESATLPIKAFGDQTDPMIAYTLNLIATRKATTAHGISSTGTPALPSNCVFNSALSINTPLVVQR